MGFGMASQAAEAPASVVLESFACTYHDGKDIDDLLAVRIAPEDPLVDEEVGLWNAMCDKPSIADCQIPKVQFVTENRRSASRNRASF